MHWTSWKPSSHYYLMPFMTEVDFEPLLHYNIHTYQKQSRASQAFSCVSEFWTYYLNTMSEERKCYHVWELNPSESSFMIVSLFFIYNLVSSFSLESYICLCYTHCGFSLHIHQSSHASTQYHTSLEPPVHNALVKRCSVNFYQHAIAVILLFKCKQQQFCIHELVE